MEYTIVSFGYEDQVRTVLVARVWYSKAGDQLITGLDELRNDIRTFRVDRITGGVRILEQVPSQQRAREAAPVPA